ncbi:tyrosine-type recombinase/integrase [Anaerocolumna sp. MB42-C2]|uniref:tyrosine-type recombinase/integrase n=1 Tax=Anaerocolumna sp. MB42-C2 TaxID=3070997 RepID=UPI0027DEDFDB|nr:tyrosine-type recombinase/integrase [Anaerocolumna sp. MB42-C2]WMJ90193.1 tyrosine-type recombinase/integrase [Anaerocolumna sp. MB42-C2]
MRKKDRILFFSLTRDFLEIYLPQDTPSEKTIKTYRDALTVFRRYINDEKGYSIKNFTFAQCTFDLVLDYRNWLVDIEKKQRSIVNNRISVIKAYIRYAAAKDITLQQIYLNVSDVPFLRLPKKVQPIIEDTEMLKALLDSPPNTKTGCRDTMILSLLYDTMIRAEELLRLDIGDLILNSVTPYLMIHGKGNKERIAPISREVLPLINAYMQEYHEIDQTEVLTPFIYTFQYGEMHRMSERNLERIVKKYADIIRKTYPELPKSISPHTFRRTRGTGLYRDGVAIEAIATIMGHASIQTTKDHYAFPSLEQKRDAIEKGSGFVVLKEEKEWPDNEDELAKLCGIR